MTQVQALAHQKFIKQSPRKLRDIAQLVDSMSVDEALAALSASSNKAAGILSKVIVQAQANAVNTKSAEAKSLRIKEIQVNEAPRLKRWRFVSRGRAHSIIKRMSHIRVEVVGALQEA